MLYSFVINESLNGVNAQRLLANAERILRQVPNPYLTVGPIAREDLARLFSQITITPAVQFNGTPCWIWMGGLDERGYGRARLHGPKVRLHRLLFAWTTHPLPTDAAQGTLDHLCRRTACCNPVHMEFVSRGENVRRKNAAKTHCKRGHPLFGENMMYRIKRKERICRTCARDRVTKFAGARPERIKEIRKAAEKAYAERYPLRIVATQARYRDSHRNEINAKRRMRYALKRTVKEQCGH